MKTRIIGVVSVWCILAGCDDGLRVPRDDHAKISAENRSVVREKAQEIPLPPASSSETVSSAKINEATTRDWEQIWELAQRDFSEAIKLIAERYSGKEAEELRARVVDQLSIRQLDGFAERLKCLTDPEVRRMTFSGVIQWWNVHDPEQLAQYALKDLKGEFQNLAVAAAASKFLTTGNFAGAVKLVERMPFSSERTNSLSNLANRWGKQDPYAALEWAEKLGVPEDKKYALLEIIPGMLEREGPHAVISVINRIDDVNVKNAGVFHVAKRLPPDEAVSWAKTLPVDLRRIAERSIINTFGTRDPERWTTYVLAIEDARVREDGVAALGRALAQGDPSKAAQWAATLPAREQEMAVDVVTSTWYNIDSMAAAAWINTLPVGAIKDRALERLARTLAPTDRSAAREVAQAISNPEKKKAMLRSVGK